MQANKHVEREINNRLEPGGFRRQSVRLSVCLCMHGSPACCECREKSNIIEEHDWNWTTRRMDLKGAACLLHSYAAKIILGIHNCKAVYTFSYAACQLEQQVEYISLKVSLRMIYEL